MSVVSLFLVFLLGLSSLLLGALVVLFDWLLFGPSHRLEPTEFYFLEDL